jgi:HAMP domain-containing protein
MITRAAIVLALVLVLQLILLVAYGRQGQRLHKLEDQLARREHSAHP